VNGQQLLERLAKASMAFKASYAGLSDLRLLDETVTSNWSVRDIIGDGTSWDEEALKHLPLILKGAKPQACRGVGKLVRQPYFASEAICQNYLTSTVVTLSAGSVSVNDEPLAGIVPMEAGCTEVCP
jgi:hypothetical protein